MATVHSNRLDQFRASVERGDDVAAEAAVMALTAADEAALLASASDADPELRWWMIRALAEIGGPASVTVLVAALDDVDADARAAAVLACSHLCRRLAGLPPTVCAAMAGLLADEDGLVRQVAGDALALCGDRAVDALADVLAGSHDGARTRATIALGKIATMPAAAVLYRYLDDANYLVREYAYQALDDMGLLENQLYLP